MFPTESETHRSESRLAIVRLCHLSLIAAVATFLIATLYPSGPPVSASALNLVFALGWIWSQSLLLVLPGLLLGTTIAWRRPKLGGAVGGILTLVAPLLVLCDAITFSWIGERFLSPSVWRLATSLRESLTNHVSRGTALFAVTTIALFTIGSVFAWWSSRRLAGRLPRAWLLFAIIIPLTGILAVPAVWEFKHTLQEMAKHSARHPLCAIGVVPYRSVGRREAITVSPAGGGLASSMDSKIADRERRHLELTVEPTGEPLRDAVIVVIESFRHELVDPQVMPALWDLAQRGTHCRSHFSTGNATTHGMFGLLNGMEAVWYSRAMNGQPLLNRLFRSAGYEVGFFAGHRDWKKFHMEGFINRDQFDVFQTDQPSWLESDRRATQRTVNFLQRIGDDDAERKPRLAILYLYCTHADYHSYAQDRIFQPAADDRFVIPYTSEAAPQVWNRYKNSGRSIDRFVSAVLGDDRVAIITGDHGEAFLEDGVCGHGVRISRFQNMTPAVIYHPGKNPKPIGQPTMHADLLPTLLSAVGLRLSDPTVLDGIDLFDSTPARLERRLFVTRNYLTDDCALIGSKLGNSCFGYRCVISLDEWRAQSLNAVDEAGFEETSALDGEALLNQWIADRFPADQPMPSQL